MGRRISISDLILLPPVNGSFEEEDDEIYPSPVLTPLLAPVPPILRLPPVSFLPLAPLSSPAEWDASLALTALSQPRSPVSTTAHCLPIDQRPNEFPRNDAVRLSIDFPRATLQLLKLPKSDKNVTCASPTSVRDRGQEAKKGFTCPHCPKKPTFSRRQELSRHLRCLHGGPSNVTYDCSQCGKRFPRADALKRHCLSLKARQGRCGGSGSPTPV